MDKSWRVILSLFLMFGFTAVAVTAVAEEEKKDDGSVSFWEKTKVSGQFNSSFNYNFNNPLTELNAVRVFDVQHNNFDINLFDLAIENKPADWAKLRVDIDAGNDVNVVDGTKSPAGVSDRAGIVGTDEFGLEQAYAELTAPIGKGLTVRAGHFVTLLGYEVIESSANWNTSRSLLFGWAIPFTHTGLLLTYPLTDTVSGTVGVVNGWDLVSDNNDGKTVIAQVSYKPSDSWFFSVQGTSGPEQTGTNNNWRSIGDFVATWNATDTLTIGVNYDVAKEPGTAGANGIVNWQGGALYAHWKPFDFIGATLRGEVFQDDGSRVAPTIPGGGITKLTLAEGTGTLHFYLGDGWETRFEVRHDWANQAVFSRSGGTGTRSFQDTVSTEVVYAF